MNLNNKSLKPEPKRFDSEDDRRLTEKRIILFQASIRTHAMADKFKISPMAASIHDAPEQYEYFGHSESTVPGGQVTTSKSIRFIRNAILGTTLMAAGALSLSGIPKTFDKFDTSQSEYSISPIAQNQTSQFKIPEKLLGNTDYVLSNNLSKYSSTEVRNSLNYVNVVFKGEDHKTLDVPSRLLLSKWASDSKGLDSVGLNWKVLYGFIHAESTWVSQEGMGKNGVKSHGLAQFENATAKSYGLTNAYDPLSAVFAAAELVKDAANWTQTRLLRLPLRNSDPRKIEQALNDGVSVAYNTGWKTRHAWSPNETQKMPAATQTHIVNVKAGVMIADNLVAEIQAGRQVATPSIEMQNEANLKAKRMIYNLRLAKSSHIHSDERRKNQKTSYEELQRAKSAKKIIEKNHYRAKPP